MIRVAHIVTMLEPGGAQRNTLYTTSHLDREKFQPMIICGPGGELDEEARKLTDVPVFFVPSLMRSIRPWSDIAALISLIKILRLKKPTIVHTHSSKAGILGRLAAHFAKVPVIIHTYHGYGFNTQQKPWTRNLFIGMERFVAKYTSAFIYVSEANRRLSQELEIGNSARHHLIRSGIKLNVFRNIKKRNSPQLIKQQLGIEPETLIATAVGPFKPQKNFSDLIEVARHVTSMVPHCCFLIVGDGQLRPELERLIRRYHLEDKIKLLGWQDDIQQILAVSDLMVSTSLWEGLPRAAVEAMTAGVPVFCYAVDGFLDFVRTGDNGALILSEDINSLSVAIILAFKDRKKLERLANGAEATIGDEFDIDRMVMQQEELYTKLTDKSK